MKYLSLLLLCVVALFAAPAVASAASPVDLALLGTELSLDAKVRVKVRAARLINVRIAPPRVRVIAPRAVIVNDVAAFRVRAVLPFTPTVFLRAGSAHASFGYGCGSAAAPPAPSADPLAIEAAELRGENRALRALLQPK